MTAVLYHYPMACSTACRIAAAEAGTDIQLCGVDIYTKKLERGGSFLDINPIGQVAALGFQDGSILTETATILVWLQSHGTVEDYRRTPDTQDYFTLLSWLNFCATELHKGLLWLLVRQDVPQAAKEMAMRGMDSKLKHVSARLEGQHGLLARGPCAADAYLIWVLSLMQFAGISVDAYPVLTRFYASMLERPQVAAILREDALKLKELRQKSA